MTTISIENVKKSFGDAHILKSVSLDIKHQEFTVLLGPSGCGKSTLLRIIAGLETQDTGVIKIGDRTVSHLPPKERNVAMVFQNYAVFPHMTVFENIAFGLRMKKAPEQKIKENVERTATLMHIDHLLHRYSGQLSGGQRQRVAVARALAVEPDVLLMDEPLSNLDALLRLQMRAELKAVLEASKTTTVYVTHDQVEAMSLADRIAVMNAGRIDQYDLPDEIYNNPATEYVGSFIGNPPMNFISPTFQRGDIPEGATQLGIRPEDFDVSTEAREDYWPITILTRERLGSHQQLSAELNGQLFRVNIANEIDVSSGNTLYLKPKDDKKRWYSESGKIIL
ncbi:ABC transporter ATP-binding protein [Marinomonas sp. 15G1-11]|uniref:ABC transporter ATP-binding protein n=1 Tax=Marinomonas phaeophyticola TaxID=3004091 RepID=A0ABT4JVB4_9GAMM|nr:ABC transporter ATP-binding protein [Marinomonas sp. 15G1-11]MCZ2722333.1 ABC transporter ATP-binding protein [Marinomonas sp. 15G1-11]